MAFKVSIRASFAKDFKKLEKSKQNFILSLADKIQNKTISGQSLTGNYKGFYKVPFSHNPEYRLVYRIYKCRKFKDNKFYCDFPDISHTDEELQSCDGLIEFVIVKTREEMNKQYKISKKEIKQKFTRL